MWNIVRQYRVHPNRQTRTTLTSLWAKSELSRAKNSNAVFWNCYVNDTCCTCYIFFYFSANLHSDPSRRPGFLCDAFVLSTVSVCGSYYDHNQCLTQLLLHTGNWSNLCTTLGLIWCGRMTQKRLNGTVFTSPLLHTYLKHHYLVPLHWRPHLNRFCFF